MSLKKHEAKSTSEARSDTIAELKKRPGLIIAIVFFVLLAGYVLFAEKPQLSDVAVEGGYARAVHETNQQTIDYYMSDINSQITGDYADTISDDYLFSIRDDFTWLKNKDNELYTAKPSTDALIREMAMSEVITDLGMANQDFLLALVPDSDQDSIIASAKTATYTPKTTFSSDIENLFTGEPARRTLFVTTYNAVMQEYISGKQTLIATTGTKERQFVEAEKVLLITAPGTIDTIPIDTVNQ